MLNTEIRISKESFCRPIIWWNEASLIAMNRLYRCLIENDDRNYNLGGLYLFRVSMPLFYSSDSRRGDRFSCLILCRSLHGDGSFLA
jgi:hypothetical protein